MHAILTSILALASLASAASTIDSASSGSIDISKVPQCALPCLVTAAGAATGCSSITDSYCLCTTGAADVVKSLIPCVCSSTCTQQELVDTLTISNGICVSAFAARGEVFNAPMPDPDLCQKYAGGAGTLPTPASGPNNSSSMSSTSSMSAMPPPASSPAGYAPQTNMTPPATNTTNETSTGTATTTSHMGTSKATNTSVPASSTGGAANVEAGMRKLGTAVLIGLVGAALATL